MADIRTLAAAGALNLRLNAGNRIAADAVEQLLGRPLPRPNSWTRAANTHVHVLWQAYDEWLFLTADGQQHALAFALRNALSSTHHALADVSDLRVAFSIEGAHARDVLQKGCAVDLHPRVFGEHSCVTTALGRVRVTLRQTSAAPAYEAFVERSYASYLRDWLLDAALEYRQATPSR